MTNRMLTLEIAEADGEAFVLCLALGTLEAIRSGAWPAQAGIWTLRRPIFFDRLAQLGIPPEVLDVLDQADELSGLEVLAGRGEMLVEVDRMIAVLRRRLGSLSDRSWYARWSDAAPQRGGEGLPTAGDKLGRPIARVRGKSGARKRAEKK